MPLYRAEPPRLSQLVEDYLIKKVSWFYWFNQRRLDTNYWLGGGDTGYDISPTILSGLPASFRLAAGGAVNYDCYIYGQNRAPFFTPWTSRWAGDYYKKVIYETQIGIEHSTDIALFIGLIRVGSVITDYTEPTVNCAHFFADTSIDDQWHARTYNGAEEQTDGLGGFYISPFRFQKLRIEWERAAVKFYIDDVLKTTHTTEVPDEACLPEWLVRTLEAGGAYRYLHVAYLNIEMI